MADACRRPTHLGLLLRALGRRGIQRTVCPIVECPPPETEVDPDGGVRGWCAGVGPGGETRLRLNSISG